MSFSVVTVGPGVTTLDCIVKCSVTLPITNSSALKYEIFNGPRMISLMTVAVSDAQKLVGLWDQSEADAEVDADDVLDMYEFLGILCTTR